MRTEEILVGVDGSAAALQAVRWATAEAVRRECGLLVVAGADVSTFGPWTGSAMIRAELRDALQPVVNEAVRMVHAAAPSVPVRGRVIIGSAPRVLVALSAGHPLLVVGRTGKGAVAAAVFGSVSRAALSSAHCPVITLAGHDNEPASVSRVLLALGRDFDEAALDFALDEADRCGAPVLAVHAWKVPSIPYPRGWHESPVPSVEIALVTSRIEQWLTERLGPERAAVVRVCVRSGPPAEVLGDLVRSGDLLVLGRHHRAPLHLARVGSLATELTRGTAVPLAIVPSRIVQPAPEASGPEASGTEASGTEASSTEASSTEAAPRLTETVVPGASGILSY